jgi:DNA-binding beta-propeller fold protein YncE
VTDPSASTPHDGKKLYLYQEASQFDDQHGNDVFDITDYNNPRKILNAGGYPTRGMVFVDADGRLLYGADTDTTTLIECDADTLTRRGTYDLGDKPRGFAVGESAGQPRWLQDALVVGTASSMTILTFPPQPGRSRLDGNPTPWRYDLRSNYRDLGLSELLDIALSPSGTTVHAIAKTNENNENKYYLIQGKLKGPETYRQDADIPPAIQIPPHDTITITPDEKYVILTSNNKNKQGIPSLELTKIRLEDGACDHIENGDQTGALVFSVESGQFWATYPIGAYRVRRLNVESNQINEGAPHFSLYENVFAGLEICLVGDEIIATCALLPGELGDKISKLYIWKIVHQGPSRPIFFAELTKAGPLLNLFTRDHLGILYFPVSI